MTQLHPQSHLQLKHSLETIHFSDLKKSEKSKKTGTMSNLDLEAPVMEIKDKEVVKKFKISGKETLFLYSSRPSYIL